jgi:MFS family permease
VSTKSPGSGYELLAQPQFRQLWIANFSSSLGSVMLLLAASWLMTSMTRNALLVALVQTSVSIPFFFFSIPAGIINDLFGYRRILLIAHVAMMIPTALLGLLAWQGRLSPWVLLLLLFLVGVGTVIHQSSWKTLLQDLVPTEQSMAAVSLNSLSNKIGQAAGPMIGGFLMGWAGGALVFGARAASHLIMIIQLGRIPQPAIPEAKDPFSLANLMRFFGEGWGYLCASPEIRGPMIRCALFMGPCAGMLALLPLEARDNVQTGVIGYGGLLAALGSGTSLGSGLMPMLHQNFRTGPMTSMALAVFSLCVLGVSQWDSMLLDAMFLFFGGFSWSILTVSHQVSVQISSPDKLRGRLTSFYMLTLQGSMALGSFVFGWIADCIGVSGSIMLSGFVAMGGLLLVKKYPLVAGKSS